MTATMQRRLVQRPAQTGPWPCPPSAAPAQGYRRGAVWHFANSRVVGKHPSAAQPLSWEAVTPSEGVGLPLCHWRGGGTFLAPNGAPCRTLPHPGAPSPLRASPGEGATRRRLVAFPHPLAVTKDCPKDLSTKPLRSPGYAQIDCIARAHTGRLCNAFAGFSHLRGQIGRKTGMANLAGPNLDFFSHQTQLRCKATQGHGWSGVCRVCLSARLPNRRMPRRGWQPGWHRVVPSCKFGHVVAPSARLCRPAHPLSTVADGAAVSRCAVRLVKVDVGRLRRQPDRPSRRTGP
jgi:hypothetical protein